jgi:hypothetical protein
MSLKPVAEPLVLDPLTPAVPIIAQMERPAKAGSELKPSHISSEKSSIELQQNPH